MAFPAAYRGAAARDRAGSQKSSPSRRPRPQPANPANDNRAPGKPANDNRPQGRSPLPKTYAPAIGAAARVGAKFARLNPYFRAASYAYDLFRYFNPEFDPMQEVAQFLSPVQGGQPVSNGGPCKARGGPSNMGFGPFNTGTSLGYSCYRGQATTRTFDDCVDDVTGNNTIVHKVTEFLLFGALKRHDTLQILNMTAPQHYKNSPAYIPMPQPGFIPGYWPSVEPEALPIHQPSPTPKPVPYELVPHRRPDRDAVPGHRWVRGPARSPAPGPDLLPSQLPAIVTTWTVRPDGSTEVEHNPNGSHTRRPPGRGEKEKKFRSRGAQAMFNIARAIGFAGEVSDLIEVGHDSLPEEFQAESDRIFDKADKLFRHSDQVDWQEFWRNWAGNDLEDRGVGRLLGGPHGRKIGWAFNGQ